MERARKRELRELNARAWAGEKNVIPTVPSPDASLKKNTAFIKRVRTGISGTSTASYLQEIKTLSLHKYLSELISACYEGLCKLKSPADIAAGVEIMSALHQRFGATDFTMSLGWYLGRGLATPDKSQLKSLSQELREKEEKERLIRQRSLLKVVTELWLVGLLKSLEDTAPPEEIVGKGKDPAVLQNGKVGEKSKAKPETSAKLANSEPFPLEALKDILPNDREHAALAMVATFVKAYAWDILGVRAERNATTSNEDTAHDTEASGEENLVTADSSLDPPFTDASMQEMFRNVLVQYLDGVKSHVVKDQRALVNQGRKNAEAYIKSGEVFEDRQNNFEKQTKAQEKLVANAQILCDVLGSTMPDLKGDDSGDTGTNGTIGLVKTAEYLRGQSDGVGIWEDEEERRFYENLIDLKDRVPGILLEDAKKKKPDNDTQVGKRNDADEAEAEKDKTTEADDQSTIITNKTVGAQVDALLTRLPELQSRDGVDQLAMDFCFMNSKASRNRLLKQIQDIPKGRSDLYPLYARLVATVSKYMPDVSTGLVTYLDDEFRSLQRRKAKEFLGQVRTGNVRYLAELTKFGVVPEHIIFHCLKVALDEFSRMNIEIIANLLEHCGKCLLRNPETAPRMKSFLETLKRKKAAHHLSQQDRMLLDNAVYYVDPPERASIEQKERTPIELYIRKLIYLDLSKRTFPKVLRSLRKLHWEELEVVAILIKVFSKPNRLKYSNIQYLAALVHHLYKYHPSFVVTVVDGLLESIVLGLEQNDFRFNQRRVAEVKYLAEFYVYRLLDSDIIFETLYQIIRFGHAENFPSTDRYNPLDHPSDYFRLRLVCTVLDTCGSFFERGSAKKKLDCFLAFFEYYIHTKEPAPQDVTFMIEHTFHQWRPKWEFAIDMESAYQRFLETRAQNIKVEEPDVTETVEAEEDYSSVDGDVEDFRDGDGDDSQQVSDAEEDEGNDANNATSDSEPEIIVTRQEEQRDPEAEAEFDRELAKLMADSVDSRKFDRKPQFDVPLPMRKGLKDISTDNEQQENNVVEAETNTMAFSLMTKRGNKQQTRTIELPSNSTFALAMRSQQEAERAEQQRIKNLVLNYDLQDSGDADGSLERNHHHHNASIQQSSHHHQGGRSNDKGTITKNGQRTRKLQLSDVDWYDKSHS